MARESATLTLTVLGAVSPYPGPGTAGPGYLVEGFGSRILLDCGSGVLSRLLHYCDYADLDAVILSHLHFDHCSDLFVLRYALDAAVRAGRRTVPLPVWCPAEPEAVAGLVGYKEALRPHPIHSGRTETIAGMAVTFLPARHPIETYHVVFAPARAPAVGPLLFYTADTELYTDLPELARGSKVLVAEASLTERQESLATQVGHLTAAQAARLGVAAEAEKVLLTHYPPDRAPGDIEAEARRAGGVRFQVAEEALRITWP